MVRRETGLELHTKNHKQDFVFSMSKLFKSIGKSVYGMKTAIGFLARETPALLPSAINTGFVSLRLDLDFPSKRKHIDCFYSP